MTMLEKLRACSLFVEPTVPPVVLLDATLTRQRNVAIGDGHRVVIVYRCAVVAPASVVVVVAIAPCRRRLFFVPLCDAAEAGAAVTGIVHAAEAAAAREFLGVDGGGRLELPVQQDERLERLTALAAQVLAPHERAGPQQRQRARPVDLIRLIRSLISPSVIR